jgi:hypothetical protein
MLQSCPKYEWTRFCAVWFRIAYEELMTTRYPQMRRSCACCGMTSDRLICSACARQAPQTTSA